MSQSAIRNPEPREVPIPSGFLQQIVRSLRALADVPAHIQERNAFRRAWARQQRQALQARSSDLHDRVSDRQAVCLSCEHDHSCVGCAIFDIATRGSGSDIPAACVKCGQGCKDWEIKQCAIVNKQNKEAVAAMAARAKDGPLLNLQLAATASPTEREVGPMAVPTSQTSEPQIPERWDGLS